MTDDHEARVMVRMEIRWVVISYRQFGIDGVAVQVSSVLTAICARGFGRSNTIIQCTFGLSDGCHDP